MLTTFDLDEYVYDALRAGASGFLLKDVAAGPAGRRHPRRGRAATRCSRRRVTRRLIERVRAHAGRSPRVPPGLEELTPRELEVFRLLARGPLERRDRGRPRGVRDHREDPRGRVLMKLGLRDRVQAVVLAYESGVVAPGEAAGE